MKRIHIIQLVTFLSAFLLFQIEFIIGKIFLPNFGGSYLVWGACIVFFQAVLLLGYLYADFIHSYVSIARYRRYHLVFILLPLIFFPGKPIAIHHSIALVQPMVVEIFWQLLFTIGPVFFVLSTQSLIWQAWLSESMLQQRDNPYALFAVSNLGSFTALLTYPFIFEFFFDLQIQQFFWRLGYGLLVAIQFLAFVLIPVKKKHMIYRKSKVKVTKETIALWLLYGAGGVVMFLAVTNIITSEIAPVPLLWVLPMAIYLLSFVLNFKKKSWCPEWIKNKLPFILTFGIFLYFIAVSRSLPMILMLALLLAHLFIVCMFCQERLYASRPQEHEGLTFFYLMLALGSFLGGICTSWIIPLLSVSHMEYFLGLFLIASAWKAGSRETFFCIRNIGGSVLFSVVIFTCLFFFEEMNWFGVILYLILIFFITHFLRKIRFGFVLNLIFIILFLSVLEEWCVRDKIIFRQRNYYGINEIFESSDARFLVQGSTIHGGQLLDQRKSHIPITYYHPRSPAGSLLLKEKGLKNVAIVGLGTGALSAYLGAGQSLDYFELDPDVLKIAKKYFTFLNSSKAKIRYIIGDARKEIEKIKGQRYQIIIVDAFSGDSVPIHLLTTQAIETYRQHLVQEGIILFHLTNRYVDFLTPLTKTAMSLGAFVGYKHDLDYISNNFHSDWIVLTWDQNRFFPLVREYQWSVLKQNEFKDIRAWTDQYSSIVSFLKND